MRMRSLLGGLLLALTAIGSVWAESGHDDYQKGVALYERHDWIGAIPYFEKAAVAGVVEAQRRLGYILWKGGADLQRSALWLRAAAVAGDEEGQRHYLAFASEFATQEVGQSDEIRSWLRQRSAEDLGAKYVLAHSYESNDDVAAVRLYSELAEAGYPSAVKRLVRAYSRGELGLSEDQQQAERLQAQLK